MWPVAGYDATIRLLREVEMENRNKERGPLNWVFLVSYPTCHVTSSRIKDPIAIRGAEQS